MQLCMLFIDSNALHVSGVTRPSSGVQEAVCAAYGSLMLLYVITCGIYFFLIVTVSKTRVINTGVKHSLKIHNIVTTCNLADISKFQIKLIPSLYG